MPAAATRLPPVPKSSRNTPRLGTTLVLLLGLAVCRPLPGQDAEASADAALRPLEERFREATGDRTKLRQELLDFRVGHPGTAAALRAAGLLRRLPSALDRLDPAAVPALERFDWQPRELVAVLGEHRGRHGGPVSCVAVSHDGATAASGGSSLVRLWDPATLRLRATLGHGGSVTSIAFSRDGKSLAAGGSAGTVQIWDVTRKDRPALKFTIQAATSPVYSVAFSPDNRTVAAGCFDNATRVYDVGGKEAKDLIHLGGHEKAVAAVAFSPDGKTLATAGHDNTVRLWARSGGDFKERSLLAGHEQPVLALAFSPRGGVLASAGADGSIRLWNVPAGPRPRERLVIPGKTAIYGLSFSPTGNTLAAACADATVRLWAVTGPRPRERHKLTGHAGAVRGVAFSPDRKTLVTGGDDWTARSWDVAGPKPKQRFEPWSHLSHVYSAAFAPDGRTLISGSEDRVIRLWDLTRAPLRTRNFLKGDSVPVYCVAYSPDGRSVAAGGAHTTVRQWDAATGRTRPPCPAHPGAVYGLAYSPDGRRLLTRSDKLLLLWDAAKGTELRRLEGHKSPVHCLAWSPDGRQAYSGSGTYLLKEGKYVFKDGKYVYTDCVLKRWEVESGRDLETVKSHTVPVYSLAAAPRGKELFSGALEPLLRRWAVGPKALTELPPWKGASSYVQLVFASPDGRTVATAGLDGRVIVWDAAGGKRLHEWALHESVGSLAYASDSRHLAVSLSTGVVYVLRLEGPEAGKGRRP